MNPFVIAFTFAGGVVLGGLYFGLLWATVRRLPDARHPGFLATASFAARVILLAGGLVVLMQGEPLRLVVALVGVVVARTLMVRRIGPGREAGREAASSEEKGEGEKGAWS